MMEKVILVVEDNEFDRNLLIQVLSKKGGFQLLGANSGEECLEIIRSKKIDLVLMDIMMPGVFGDLILSKIREQYNPIQLPIIMVTSKVEALDIVGCLQRGANDYITKPVHFDIAISRITTHLMLSSLSHEMSKMKEMVALDGLIATYNHEINNPLLIAMSCLSLMPNKEGEIFEKLKGALWRIADIVKKIKELANQKEVEYSQYTEDTMMIKLKKN